VVHCRVGVEGVSGGDWWVWGGGGGGGWEGGVGGSVCDEVGRKWRRGR